MVRADVDRPLSREEAAMLLRCVFRGKIGYVAEDRAVPVSEMARALEAEGVPLSLVADISRSSIRMFVDDLLRAGEGV